MAWDTLAAILDKERLMLASSRLFASLPHPGHSLAEGDSGEGYSSLGGVVPSSVTMGRAVVSHHRVAGSVALLGVVTALHHYHYHQPIDNRIYCL